MRPKLLFLCQNLPFPPDGGAHIRTFHTMRILAQEFDLTVLCFYRRATRNTTADVDRGVASLRSFADVHAFAIPQEHSATRLIWDHSRSVLRRRAYTIYAYSSKAFRTALRGALHAQAYDIIHLDSLDLSGYIPLVGATPFVCTHHNIESVLLRRRAALEKRTLLSHYFRFQSRLMEKEERRWAPKAALNIVVSEADRASLETIAPLATTTIVPNGVDTDYFRPSAADNRNIVFVGGYDWFPNRDGGEYFLEHILPRIRRGHPSVRMQWIGRMPAPVRSRLQLAYDIDTLGYVDDIRPYIQAAACYIVPLRVGGGTRLKILDAWAMGKAVVSTALGCEGLRARDGQNILIRDNVENFAQAVTDVLGDAELRNRIGSNARNTAVEWYSWARIGVDMLPSYQQLLGNSVA